MRQVKLLQTLADGMSIVVGICNAAVNVDVENKTLIAPAMQSLAVACMQRQAVIAEGVFGL